MKVQVRLFAALREATGTTRMALELPPGARVQDLMDFLAREYPALRSQMSAVRAAVNRQYVSLQAELHDGDEVALVPPVGGG
jgi:molybdopterin converting factor subunit 1